MTHDTIESLQKENEALKKRLALCQKWMEREVDGQVLAIKSRRTVKKTESGTKRFLEENQVMIVSERIRKYYGDILLMNAPKHFLDHLIDSEINFYTLSKNPEWDGLAVISSYNKILDSLIEMHIIREYRKFAEKQGMITLRSNDPLEKALFLVVSKKYILSTWRLYSLIRALRKKEALLEFGKLFQKFLEKRPDLHHLLLSDDFFLPYSKLIEEWIFWEKRHNGRISFEDTKKARTSMSGDFQRGGIIWMFLEYGTVLF